MNKDLTLGKPRQVLWGFCLPLLGSILFQQLYNIADSLIAGKFVGENALAAVGNSYEVTLIFIAFAFGCNIGCSVVVSQLFGAKDYGQLKTAVYTTLAAGAALCGALMLFGLMCCVGLLRLINTPAELMADSQLYLEIYIWGLPFLFFYNISTGIFSALGDSKTPFLFLAASSLSNIGMDIFFVTVFGMGVAGVAWATFICQGISCLLALWFVFRRLAAIGAQAPVKRFSWSLLGRVARIAVPSVLQQSFISVGNIVIQGTINQFGASVMAGYSASVKLNNLVVTSFTTLGNGISNFTAQNLGACKPERVRAGFKAGLHLVWMLCVPLAMIYFLAGRSLVRLFMDDASALALETGVTFLKVLSPFYFFVAAKLVADGVLRGAGLMQQFMLATFVDLSLRVVLAILLSAFMGPTGIWCAWPASWIVAMALSLMFYKRGSWAAAARDCNQQPGMLP